jgi:hypothetical protein
LFVEYADLSFSDQKLIVQKSKKVRNEELPEWVELQWFRHTFVTTYMAFVGQTYNPWDVPVKQALIVMQKIWDACSAYQYEITSSSAVYQKVRVFFVLG